MICDNNNNICDWESASRFIWDILIDFLLTESNCIEQSILDQRAQPMEG